MAVNLSIKKIKLVISSQTCIKFLQENLGNFFFVNIVIKKPHVSSLMFLKTKWSIYFSQKGNGEKNHMYGIKSARFISRDKI